MKKGDNISENMFLVCFHMKTIKLSPHRSLSIGREKFNDVVLNDLLVSRRHAVIEWNAGQYIITDMNSRNGTFVNKKKIDSVPLSEGDVIKIGGYEFFVRTSTQMDIEKMLLQERSKISSQDTLVDSDLGIKFSDSGFSGDLSVLSLIEVVQTLSQCLKTGLLSISDNMSEDQASVYFVDGEIIHADYRDIKGFQAVIKILGMNKGTFEFKNDISSPERSITQSTMGILLEACRLRDETHREDTRS